MFNILLDIKQKLIDTGKLSSVYIGAESVSADDTPFALIVSKRAENAGYQDTLYVKVYIGTDIKHTMQETYEEHMNLLSVIRSALNTKNIGTGVCRYERTHFDEDSIDNFKISILEFKVERIKFGC